MYNFFAKNRILFIFSLTIAIVVLVNIYSVVSTQEKRSVTAQNYMIATANPQASAAGYKILKSGGSAIDAIIAAQMVLNVVEPQSSGIGGGGFLLYWDAENKQLKSYDGRETAPISSTPSLFLDKNEKPILFEKALIGGLAVGTPGLLHMLDMAHQEYGNVEWKHLFYDAINIARDGFIVSSYLSQQIEKTQNKYGGLDVDKDTRLLFLTDSGFPKSEGTVIKNEALADTFRLIAKHGISVFYQGIIKDDIVNKVKNSVNPGLLQSEDFSIYSAKKRKPLCKDYKQYKICTMPPPTSGGVTLLQIIAMLEDKDLEQHKNTALGLHLFAEASKLAFADRNRYLADSDFVSVPTEELLNSDYLHKRSKHIQETRSIRESMPGQLSNFISSNQADHGIQPKIGTSHLVAIDKEGNIASMTSSIESRFGSRLTVRGFLLNNELTDFSFLPTVNNRVVANRVQPGKRPRSSMTPVIVFDKKTGEPILAIGSPGGSRIINYVAKSLISFLDWQEDIDTAIHAGNITARKEPIEIEKGSQYEKLKHELEMLGHEVKVRPLKSGLTAIAIQKGFRKNKLTGSADRRREGTVLGD